MRHGAGLDHTPDMGERKLVVIGNCVLPGVAESKASSRNMLVELVSREVSGMAPGTRFLHTECRQLRRISQTCFRIFQDSLISLT